MFFAATSDISRNPLSYQKVYRDFHRRLVRRFPYAIYYEVSRDEVIVFGLFHYARSPKTIASPLPTTRCAGAPERVRVRGKSEILVAEKLYPFFVGFVVRNDYLNPYGLNLIPF